MAETVPQDYNSTIPTLTPDELFPEPTLEEKIAIGENLQPVEVYKDDQRFYVAKVTDGSHIFKLKEISPSASQDNDPQQVNTHSYQLFTEIEALKFLDTSLRDGARITPKLLLTGMKPGPYYLAEHLENQSWLGSPNSNFFFNHEMLNSTAPEKIFNSIGSLQSLTSDANVPERIKDPNRANRYVVHKDDVANFIERFKTVNDQPVFSEEDMATIPEAASHAHDDTPSVLCHGEVFPPHIFVSSSENNALLIDWENTRLDNPYIDHVAVWVRAFENPEWQARYQELVKNQPGFNARAWNATVFLIAKGNIDYVVSDREQVDEERKLAAQQFCINAAIVSLRNSI